MAIATARTYNEQLLGIVRLYLKTGGSEPVNLDDLAKFAIDGGHWQRNTPKLLELCKREFSRALRGHYHIDPQGRQVRTYHAVKSHDSRRRQLVFWADIRSAPAEHTEASFQQRRNQIVGACWQLKRDVDSYNENNSGGKHVQMMFDFTTDLAELEQPAEYRPRQPR